MLMRYVIWGGLALIALPLAGFGLWLATLPAATAVAIAPAIPQAEVDATLAALKPPKRARPLIAVISLNDATETTDYIMPAGILRRADIANVAMLSTEPGPVELYPALKVEADATIGAFDAAHPDGADYVIVPAMSRDDDPTVTAWLRKQARSGAIIIAVCAGAKVAAAAGLLDDKRATTHWYYRGELLERHPSIRYIPDRRIVVDVRVATTTGISASMPTALTLIEAIAGRQKAVQVAESLGLESWDARHASDAFVFTRPFATTVMINSLAFWRRDSFGISLEPGMDEVSLALVADAWSRTYRSRAETFAATPAAVVTLGGLRLLPDEAASKHTGSPLPFDESKPAVEAVNAALNVIGERYGRATADVVAMQLEYPRSVSSP